MLKASFSGNVNVLFLKRVNFPVIFRQEHQQQQQFAWRYFTQTQIRLSSFSARFAARLPGGNGKEADSSASTEPGTDSAESVESGPDQAWPQTIDDRRKLRSVYLTWAPIAPPGAPVANVCKWKDKTRIGRTSLTKQAVARRRATASPDRQHRIKPGRCRPRSQECGKAANTHSMVDYSTIAEARVVKKPCSSLENGKPPRISDNDRQHEPEENINPSVVTLGEDIQVQDLSIEQLQAIIFDRRIDLMGLAWDAYQRLVVVEAEEGGFLRGNPTPNGLFGTELLTTLANRLVARRKYHRKNCREIFLRLLSVYARLRRERAGVAGVPYLRTVEWNCLIHFAGTGLRGKTTLGAYNAALDVYDDMLRGIEDAKAAGCDSLLKDIVPDIYTYTTLLSIALRSEHQPAINHAMNLLRESGKEPSRITRLCTIRYRYKCDGFSGVRDLLSSMRPEDIGSDGITAYMMCAGNEGDLDVVWNIYNALRQNVETHDDGTYGPLSRFKHSNDRQGINVTEEYVSVEGIRLPRTFVPSEAVYNYTIQILAYHGHLTDALQVFTDMLSTRRPDAKGSFFQPNYVVFRGLFLGFARHSYGQSQDLISRALTSISEDQEWTWDRFCFVLDAFIDHGDRMEPSERMVYWIMTTVRKMTGDERLVREVWQRLNSRWYIRKGGRLKILDIKYGQPQEEAHAE